MKGIIAIVIAIAAITIMLRGLMGYTGFLEVFVMTVIIISFMIGVVKIFLFE